MENFWNGFEKRAGVWQWAKNLVAKGAKSVSAWAEKAAPKATAAAKGTADAVAGGAPGVVDKVRSHIGAHPLSYAGGAVATGAVGGHLLGSSRND